MTLFLFLNTQLFAYVSVCRLEFFQHCQTEFKCFIFRTQLGNAEHYNSYLQSLKGSIPNRGLEVFWELLVQGMIRHFN